MLCLCIQAWWWRWVEVHTTLSYDCVDYLRPPMSALISPSRKTCHRDGIVSAVIQKHNLSPYNHTNTQFEAPGRVNQSNKREPLSLWEGKRKRREGRTRSGSCNKSSHSHFSLVLVSAGLIRSDRYLGPTDSHLILDWY